MPRPGRIAVEGGVFHVSNRVGRGERVFDDDETSQAFVGLLREVVERDGLTVLAWYLIPNHYLLAVRTGAITLDRPMRSLQHRITRRINVRRKVFGPLWQGRCRAKLVEDPRYLDQLLVLGVERYGLRVRTLATALGKSPDWMSNVLDRGIRRRVEDGEIRAEVDRLDRALADELA